MSFLDILPAVAAGLGVADGGGPTTAAPPATAPVVVRALASSKRTASRELTGRERQAEASPSPAWPNSQAVVFRPCRSFTIEATPSYDVARAAADVADFRLNSCDDARGKRRSWRWSTRRSGRSGTRPSYGLRTGSTLRHRLAPPAATLLRELAATEQALDRLHGTIAQARAAVGPVRQELAKPKVAGAPSPSPAEIMAAKALARGKLMVALSLTIGLVPPSTTTAIRTSLRRFG